MGTTNNAEQMVMSGQVWEQFCDTVKSAGQIILREKSPANPFDRAEGFRYLSRLVRGAVESFMEDVSPLYPRLAKLPHMVKIGADNPDNYYQSASISGKYDYRIRGTRGTIHYISIGAYSGNYGQGTTAGGRAGCLEDHQLEVNPDGTLEITLSCNEHPGNWIRMEPDTGLLIVRQSFLDRENEELAELQIECLNAEGPPSPLTSEDVIHGLGMASLWVVGCATRFTDWAEGFAQRPNELHPLDDAVSTAAHADPNIYFFHGYWTIASDEALIIETTPPECDYWNFQLNNYWMESLDYRYHQITVNKHTAKYEPDGSVRMVVAHRNPGIPNWMDTAGHSHGTMGLRWVRADHFPAPKTRVVQLSELV